VTKGCQSTVVPVIVSLRTSVTHESPAAKVE
jgi:hypothetical protein